MSTMLHEWAQQWGVSMAAVVDLKRRMGLAGDHAPPVDPETGKAGSEARQQNLIRISAAQQGVWLTRNNVGALIDTTGRPVRYGLANESKEQNKAVKSADLIGINPVLITPKHLDTVIGQFTSVEAKEQGWAYSGNAHEVAQLSWAEFVISKGGYATFATGPINFNQQR